MKTTPKTSKKIKLWVLITRIIGLAMIVFAAWMYLHDITYSSTFDRYYNGIQKEQITIQLGYIKVLVIGCVILFFREIMQYLDYVKYS